MAESGGLENRCTLTGTVGSNPTLSASFSRFRILKSETAVERSPNGMAPRWKRGGSKGLWGFESPSLRSQFIPEFSNSGILSGSGLRAISDA